MLAMCAHKCRLGLHSTELEPRVPLRESKSCQRQDNQPRQRCTYSGGWVTGEYAVFHTILEQVGPGEMLRQELVWPLGFGGTELALLWRRRGHLASRESPCRSGRFKVNQQPGSSHTTTSARDEEENREGKRRVNRKLELARARRMRR